MKFAEMTEEGRRLAPLIDHTLLKADAREAQVIELCREAAHYGFAAVCVNGSRVEVCVRALAGSPVKVCTVAGFPLGACSGEVKAFEAREALKRGAGEIDMVLCVGAMKDGRYAYVAEDIAGVVRAAEGRVVKVILETALLTDEEKTRACRLALAAGAHFVKTSTGFGGGGATEQDIRLMREAVEGRMGVKASGGIKTAAQARALVRAGASRLGTSSGVAIVTGASVGGGG